MEQEICLNDSDGGGNRAMTSIECYITREDGDIVWTAEEGLIDGGSDQQARDDIENDVLFRYYPNRDHTLRSQFVYYEGDQKNRMVAVTKFKEAENVDLAIHAEFIDDFASDSESDDYHSIPNTSFEWGDTLFTTQSLHFGLANDSRRGLTNSISGKIRNRDNPTIEADSPSDAADIISYVLNWDEGSMAVSIHGRIPELNDVDIVIVINNNRNIVKTNRKEDSPNIIGDQSSNNIPRECKKQSKSQNNNSIDSPTGRKHQGNKRSQNKNVKTGAQKGHSETKQNAERSNKKPGEVQNSQADMEPLEESKSGSFSNLTDETHTSRSDNDYSGTNDCDPVSWLPTASGLSVFDGPTGRLIYDESDKLILDKEYNEVNEVYLDDVVFYHSPAAGELLVYTNGRVGGANQQLLLHYLNPEARDLLSEFQKKVKNLFENKSGWGIMWDAGNYQEVFDNLTKANHRHSTVSEDELSEVLSSGANLDFGSPSSLAAIEFITSLRNDFGLNGTVAIVGSGRPDYLENVNVVVMPSSLNYSEVSPRNETSDIIRFSRFKNIIDRAGERFKKACKNSEQEAIKSQTRQWALANTVTEAADCAPTLRPTSEYRIYNSSVAIVTAATMLVMLAATTVYLGWSGLAGEFVASLTTSVFITVLPWITHETLSSVQPFVVPLWVPLGVVTIAVFIPVSIILSRKLRLADVVKPLSIITTEGSTELNRETAKLLDNMEEDLGHADEIISDIDDNYLQSNLNHLFDSIPFDRTELQAEDPGSEYVEAKFQHINHTLDIVDPKVIKSKRREWLATGIGLGLFMGAIISLVYLGVVYTHTMFLETTAPVLILLSNFAVLMIILFSVAAIVSAVR